MTTPRAHPPRDWRSLLTRYCATPGCGSELTLRPRAERCRACAEERAKEKRRSYR